MREENLFQLATEELNSRDRKTELWARACALATDDVDEARYLYTNLRVEELAKEHNIDLSASAPEPSERGEFTLLEEDDKVDDTVSLSVQYVDDMVATGKTPPPVDADATAMTPNEEGLTPAQVALQRARSKFTEDSVSAAGETADATENPGGATVGSDVEAENKSEITKPGDPHSDLSLSDLTADASEVADNTILIDAERGESADGAAMNLLDPEDATAAASDTTASADAPQPIGPTETSALPILTDTPDNDFFSDSTESSSVDDFMSASSSDVKSTAEASDELTLPSLDSGTEAAATEDPGNNATIAALAAGAAATVAAGAANSKAASPKTNIEDTTQNQSAALSESVDEANELPELDTDVVEDVEDIGDVEIAAARVEHDSVDRFDIYRNSEGLVNAVELGNSWKALLLTIPWMLSRRLWGHSILYVVMSLVLIFGLLAMVPRALAAGATSVDMLVAAGFALLGIVGWLVLPFKQANRWHAARVTSKGYEFQSSADANTRKEAEQRFLVRYRLENPVVKQADVWKNAA